MGTRRVWLALAVLLAPGGAYADDHWFDAYGAYSGAALSWVDGGQVTLTFPFPLFKDVPEKRLNLILDYAFHNGQHKNQDLDQDTWAGGLRRTFRTGKTALLFGQALLVREEREGSSLDGDHWGVAIGTGVEVLKRRPGSIIGLGVKTQGDLVYLFGADERKLYPRASIGLVVRFNWD